MLHPSSATWAGWNINIACLDDLDVDELLAAPIHYFDGRNDDWHARPVETRHL